MAENDDISASYSATDSAEASVAHPSQPARPESDNSACDGSATDTAKASVADNHLHVQEVTAKTTDATDATDTLRGPRAHSSLPPIKRKLTSNKRKRKRSKL
jgi:hypothetical protein